MDNTDLTEDGRERDRQSASETEEAPLDGFGIDRSPRGGQRGEYKRERERGMRGAHEKFETPGVEMLSGMQERTILIRESARACGAAWPGVATRVQHARAISMRASGTPRIGRQYR